MLPSPGVTLSPSSPVPQDLLWSEQRRQSGLQLIPAGLAGDGDHSAQSAETWTKRCETADAMLPHIMAKFAVSRANRQWARIGNTSWSSFTQSTVIRIYECVRSSLIALVYLGRLIIIYYLLIINK